MGDVGRIRRKEMRSGGMDEEWETDEGADEESTCTKPLYC